THAPVPAAQALAPQVASPVAQAEPQQKPVPFTPQAPEEHSLLAEHASPGSFSMHSLPELHLPLAQSAALLQTLPTAHFGHAAAPLKPLPPQSWSVSLPFFTVSLQVGSVQVPDLQ